MKGILLFFAVVFGGMIYINQSLQNGRILAYIDQHPQERGVAEATYYIGQGYYLFQNLQQATTYFIRVAERYPKHPKAEPAFFYYVQARVDSMSFPRTQIVQDYLTYIEKFPEGEHAQLVQNRIDTYRTGGN